MSDFVNIDDVIKEVNRLTSATRVLQPEQSVLRCLTFLDIALKKTPKKKLKSIDVINNSLRALVKINGGKLSFQCAISVSRHLSSFFLLFQKTAPYEETVNDFLMHLTSVNATIAIGDLLHDIGPKNGDLVFRALSKLNITPQRLAHFEILYALHRIFKGMKSKGAKNAVSIHSLLIRHFHSFPESFHIIALKLLRSLVLSDIPTLWRQTVDFCEGIISRNGTVSQFAKDEASKTVALIASHLALFTSINIVHTNHSNNSTNINSTTTNSISNSNNTISPNNEKADLANAAAVLQRGVKAKNAGQSHVGVPSRFVERVRPAAVVARSTDLLKLLRAACPAKVGDVVPFLSRAARDAFFGQVLSERKQSIAQVIVLHALRVDTYAAAGIAAHLAHSRSQLEQEFAAAFFVKCVDFTTKIAFLKSALAQLKNKFELGDFIIARCLAGDFLAGYTERTAKSKKIIINTNTDINSNNNNTCINNNINTNINNNANNNNVNNNITNNANANVINGVGRKYGYADDFLCLSANDREFVRLINDFIDDMVFKKWFSHPLLWLLARDAENAHVESAVEAALSNGGILLIDSLLCFFSAHTDCLQIMTLLRYIQTHISVLNNRSILSLIDLLLSIYSSKNNLYKNDNNDNNDNKESRDNSSNGFTEINSFLVNFLVVHFLQNPPNQSCFSSLINRPMSLLLASDQSGSVSDSGDQSSDSSDNSLLSIVPEHQQVSQKILANISLIFDSLTAQRAENIVNKLLLANISKESHALILQLVKNKKLKNLNVDMILSTLTGNDYLRLELTCEVISLLDPPIEKIYKFINSDTNKGNSSNSSSKGSNINSNNSYSPSSYLLLSSFFCNSLNSLPNNYLNMFLNSSSFFDINTLSNNLFALHALSSLLFAHSVEIMALDIGFCTNNLLQTLLILVNSDLSMRPLFLKLICEVFLNLLPILSLDLHNNVEMCALVLSIIESVKCSSNEFAKVCYYEMALSALTYAPQLAATYFHFIYSNKASRRVRLASIDSISRSLKMIYYDSNNNTIDISAYLKKKKKSTHSHHKTRDDDSLYFNCLQDLFIFLQQTNDERVKECIKTICYSSTNLFNKIYVDCINNPEKKRKFGEIAEIENENDNESEYTNRNANFNLNDQFLVIANCVFVKNCVPGFPDICPSFKVKESALYCIEQIFDKRDSLYCLAKALENVASSNQEADYIYNKKLMEKIFELFTRLMFLNNKRSNSNNNNNSKHKSELINYELIRDFKSELFVVARFAFENDLKISKSFLSALLNKETLNDFFDLFTEAKCVQRSTEFFELATKCCKLASRHFCLACKPGGSSATSSFSHKLIKIDSAKEFGKLLLPFLKEIIEKHIIFSNSSNKNTSNCEDDPNLWLNAISKTNEKNNFVLSKFYKNLFNSFVYIEKVLDLEVIPNDILYSYLNIELLTLITLCSPQSADNVNVKKNDIIISNEFMLRLKATLKGLIEFVKNYKIGDELIDETLQSFCRFSTETLVLLQIDIYLFVLFTIKSHKNSSNKANDDIPHSYQQQQQQQQQQQTQLCSHIYDLSDSSFQKILYLSQFVEFDFEIISYLYRKFGPENLPYNIQISANESDSCKIALFRLFCEKNSENRVNTLLISKMIDEINENSISSFNERFEYYKYFIKYYNNFNENKLISHKDKMNNKKIVDQFTNNILSFIGNEKTSKKGNILIYEAIQSNSVVLSSLINQIVNKYSKENPNIKKEEVFLNKDDSILLSLFAKKYLSRRQNKSCHKLSRILTNLAFQFLICGNEDNNKDEEKNDVKIEKDKTEENENELAESKKNAIQLIRVLLEANKKSVNKVWSNLKEVEHEIILSGIERLKNGNL